SKQSSAVGANAGESIADWMHPIRIEKCGGSSAIPQRKMAADCPRLLCNLLFEPSIGDVQHRPGLCDALSVVLAIGSHAIQNQLLHWCHDVVVKEPIHKAHPEGCVDSFGNQSRWSRVPKHQMFNDDGGFYDRCLAIFKNREF